MGWENINLSDIKVVDEKAVVPSGTYILQLMGAFENKRNPSDTDLLFRIVDEGDFKGKSVYLDLPDPDRLPWAAPLAARIFQALGVTPAPFTNPRDEFNRVAQNGHSRLTADVYVRDFTRSDGTAGQQNKIQQKSIRPAA
jgi:hypothetical protein